MEKNKSASDLSDLGILPPKKVATLKVALFTSWIAHVIESGFPMLNLNNMASDKHPLAVANSAFEDFDPPRGRVDLMFDYASKYFGMPHGMAVNVLWYPGTFLLSHGFYQMHAERLTVGAELTVEEWIVAARLALAIYNNEVSAA